MSSLEEKTQEGSELTVHYCDSSNEVKTFDDTAWGNIEARDQYNSYVERGLLNDSIFERNKPVHVVQVKLWHARKMAQYDFVCCHTKAKEEKRA